MKAINTNFFIVIFIIIISIIIVVVVLFSNDQPLKEVFNQPSMKITIEDMEKKFLNSFISSIIFSIFSK